MNNDSKEQIEFKSALRITQSESIRGEAKLKF